MKALIAELDQDASEWFHPDEATMANLVEQALRQRHSELTDEAVKALATQFAYTLQIDHLLYSAQRTASTRAPAG